ncbi:MAG TPA: alpha/beta fold hydrolase [Actinomycetota bacterium]|nr:alpha/beta fold hydrolase [Actinomycetota bacterium]
MPTIRSGNATIAYDVTGDGDPLLMLMGFASDRRMWMLQLPAFAERYRCITIDNRGTGESPLPDEPCTMEDMAQDALGVLDELGIERAHALGISMGGAIAQHIALKAPDRVRSLTLAATWSARNAYTQRVAYLGKRVLNELGEEAFVRAIMLWLFTPKFLINNADFAAGIESMMLQFSAPRATFNMQLEALLEHEVTDQLVALDMPTLVIVGRRDILVPPELSEQIAAAIPHAEFKYLESGHAFNVEEMETFNTTILDFLARH